MLLWRHFNICYKSTSADCCFLFDSKKHIVLYLLIRYRYLLFFCLYLGQTPKVTCLCLGPTGSGKSLLLRRLQNRHVVDNTTSTVPTVGTNIVTVPLSEQVMYRIRNIHIIRLQLLHANSISNHTQKESGIYS